MSKNMRNSVVPITTGIPVSLWLFPFTEKVSYTEEKVLEVTICE
jgi:hypothetical protein